MRKRHWWGSLARHRHSRGFGIHSPFAYDLLKNTLRERLPYYAYSEITDVSLRLLLRLVCRLRPSSVAVYGEQLSSGVDVVLMADSNICVDSKLPDMLYLSQGAEVDRVSIADCLERGGTVIVADKVSLADVYDFIFETMERGMTFSNGRVLVAVGRSDLPRQHFELYF